MTEATEPVELWRHPSPETTQMWFFKERVEKKYGVVLKDYRDLYNWSIENIADFWRETCLFTGVHAKKAGTSVDASFDQILDQDAPMFPRPDFFPGTELNFAQNLLYPRHPQSKEGVQDQDIAIIAATETSRSEVTWAELRKRVGECYNALQHQGVKPLDRVAGFVGNHTNAIVAMLAATALGAIWTAVSPDTGVGAVLDRLVQIEPVVLFADNASLYNGKVHETSAKIREIVASLPKLQALVVFEEVSAVKMQENLAGLKPPTGASYTYRESPKSENPIAQNKFTLFPPSHPAYILYSSGTTGKPKCIVHSAAGTLIQHKKEHILHCDIRPGDRLFYFTTTTWMMWHWLISALASGATLILYDGSPFVPHGPLTMPKLIDELHITQFGTSAKYLSVLEQKSCFPKTQTLTLSS
ncbi:Malonamoyl-CoA synthetase vrtB, partial [Lachnellula suecica]